MAAEPDPSLIFASVKRIMATPTLDHVLHSVFPDPREELSAISANLRRVQALSPRLRGTPTPQQTDERARYPVQPTLESGDMLPPVLKSYGWDYDLVGPILDCYGWPWGDDLFSMVWEARIYNNSGNDARDLVNYFRLFNHEFLSMLDVLQRYLTSSPF